MVSQRFEGIDPERWTAIKQVLHSDYHLSIDGDEGTSATHGIEFSWLWGGDEWLTVTITIPKIEWALKLAGIHCEQDAMNVLAKKIEGMS